jgi:fatty-acyl-CoA synthase
VKEANVYGVAIPGMEGRAGMAALVTDASFDITKLSEALSGNLASYARPLFVRVQPQIEITGTFKHRKIDLVREGFDPEIVTVPLYWLNPSGTGYESLTHADYAAIVAGSVKL